MKGKPLSLLIATFAGLLFGGTAARADMPAVDSYWANADAIVKAASVFPAGETATFKAQLEKALVQGGQPKKGLDPSYKKVEKNAFFGAFGALIKPHVEKGEIQKVHDFLKKVSEGKWIQGHLLARNGGDFVTLLELVAGSDGKYVLRQFNEAVNPGRWNGTTFDSSLGVAVKKADAKGPPRAKPTPAK